MTDLGLWHARHVATPLQELDSVSEGSGTLLDHTAMGQPDDSFGLTDPTGADGSNIPLAGPLDDLRR
jgi:hypothetical protein